MRTKKEGRKERKKGKRKRETVTIPSSRYYTFTVRYDNHFSTRQTTDPTFTTKKAGTCMISVQVQTLFTA